MKEQKLFSWFAQDWDGITEINKGYLEKGWQYLSAIPCPHGRHDQSAGYYLIVLEREKPNENTGT